MADIINFPFIATAPVSPEEVIRGALETEFEEIIIIGVTKKDEPYLASSTSNIPDILFLIEKMKYELLASES